MKVDRRVGEPILFAYRRLNKMLMRSGLYSELRRRENFVKPSQKRRQAEAKKKFNAARNNNNGSIG
jgi:ribosomal protein S21